MSTMKLNVSSIEHCSRGKGCALCSGLNVESTIYFFIIFSKCPRDFWQLLQLGMSTISTISAKSSWNTHTVLRGFYPCPISLSVMRV